MAGFSIFYCHHKGRGLSLILPVWTKSWRAMMGFLNSHCECSPVRLFSGCFQNSVLWDPLNTLPRMKVVDKTDSDWMDVLKSATSVALDTSLCTERLLDTFFVSTISLPLLRLPQSYSGLVHTVDGRQLWIFQPPYSQPFSFLDLELGLHCIIIQSRLTLISFNLAVLKVKSSNEGPFLPTPFLFLHNWNRLAHLPAPFISFLFFLHFIDPKYL